MTALQLIAELIKYPGETEVVYPGEHEGDQDDVTEVKYYDADHNFGKPTIVLS